MLALTTSFFKKNLSLIFFLISFPAFAHHPMGGELPQNFLNGILSGIAHPIIGFDHLAFILTFGIITSYFKNKVILPLYFVTFSLMGTIVSVNFLVVPFSELIISLSIIIAGLTSLYDKEN
jgi:urease accessory protein